MARFAHDATENLHTHVASSDRTSTTKDLGPPTVTTQASADGGDHAGQRLTALPSLTHVLLRNWRMLFVAGVTAFVVTYAVSSAIAPTYSASTDLALTPSAELMSGLGDQPFTIDRTLRTEAWRISSATMLDVAGRNLAVTRSGADLAEQVTTSVDNDANVITITATGRSAGEAAEIANVVAATYRRDLTQRRKAAIKKLRSQSADLTRRISEQENELTSQLRSTGATTRGGASTLALEASLENSVDRLDAIQQRLDQIAADQAGGGGTATVLSVAEAPAEPKSPRPLRYALMVGAIVAFLIASWRWWSAGPQPMRLDGPDMAERVMGAPVIAELSDRHRSGTRVVASPRSLQADGYRNIAVALRQSVTRRSSTTVFAAASTGALTGTVVANVAALFGFEGYSTIVVAGPASSIGPGARHQPPLGLTDIVSRGVHLSECLISGVAEGSLLFRVLPWGPRHSALAALEQRRIADVLADLSAGFDHVLIECASFHHYAESAQLTAHADDVVVVAEIGSTVDELRRLRDQLSRAGCPVTGVVLVPPATPRPQLGRRSSRMSVRIKWDGPRPSKVDAE